MNQPHQPPSLQSIEPTLRKDVTFSQPGSDKATLAAPSFAEPIPDVTTRNLEAGDIVQDFELLRELGRGGFATVFLARQLSLGRQVALKVSPQRGREAQTMASLEHDHIVQVFSESIDGLRKKRLLCMQYIAGTTLAEVMQNLPASIRTGGTGNDFLTVLDQVCHHRDEFKPSLLQERQSLASGAFFEAVCWLGSRLCAALEFAHEKGVLHRDIKPANILLNNYGRPFLADFNLACQADQAEDVIVGGTLPYMSPEHLKAFLSQENDDWKQVNEQSDIYSLGVVLYELATGVKPYPSLRELGPGLELYEQRLIPIDQLRTSTPPIPASLDLILRKCLAPDPTQRFSTASALRQALDACRIHLRSLQQLPAIPHSTRLLHHYPFISLVLISTVTNILGSIVNTSYNLIHVVDKLSPLQQKAFQWVILIYNGLAYPLLVGFTIYLLRKRYLDWQQVQQGRMYTAEQFTTLRKRFNFLATWSILGSALGWLPGGIIFPAAIHFGSEPLSLETFIHFVISFTLSGMIAVTYCYLGTQYLVLRELLPDLCAVSSEQQLKNELKPIPGRLAFFQMLAGIIPLSGALMVVMIGYSSYGDNWFRLLVCMLIVLGMIGFVLSLQVSQYLQRVLSALLKPE